MKTVSKEYEAYNNLNIKMGTKKRNKGIYKLWESKIVDLDY